MCSTLTHGLFQSPLSSSVKWTIPELFRSRSDGEEQQVDENEKGVWLNIVDSL